MTGPSGRPKSPDPSASTASELRLFFCSVARHSRSNPSGCVTGVAGRMPWPGQRRQATAEIAEKSEEESAEQSATRCSDGRDCGQSREEVRVLTWCAAGVQRVLGERGAVELVGVVELGWFGVLPLSALCQRERQKAVSDRQKVGKAILRSAASVSQCAPRRHLKHLGQRRGFRDETGS